MKLRYMFRKKHLEILMVHFYRNILQYQMEYFEMAQNIQFIHQIHNH